VDREAFRDAMNEGCDISHTTVALHRYPCAKVPAPNGES
jgi:hypothetical protein